MTSSGFSAAISRVHRILLGAVLAASLAAGVSIAVAAQDRPPVRGTIALPATMKTFYRALNTIVVTTIDGVQHVYHFTKNLVVHGGKGVGVEALAGLREGSTVVVHSGGEGAEPTVEEVDIIGDEGLKVTEGMVTHVDRRHKQITVRLEGGRIERFRLTERAAAEAPPEVTSAGTGETKVMIYYADENGQKVAHAFRKIS
jgi:hypothetical protein